MIGRLESIIFTTCKHREQRLLSLNHYIFKIHPYFRRFHSCTTLSLHHHIRRTILKMYIIIFNRLLYLRYSFYILISRSSISSSWRHGLSDLVLPCIRMRFSTSSLFLHVHARSMDNSCSKIGPVQEKVKSQRVEDHSA
uniref:Uncharacterized protein n=1 Tax=Anopheles funestus TaxID=62324 RepID=A0A182S2A5_ANOFN